MRSYLLAAIMTAATLTGAAVAATVTPEDPFTWLEEIEGQRALDWARAENARSLPVLQNDPRYQGFLDEALKIVNAKDRIPAVAFSGPNESELRNYWQDPDHVRGLWRRTTMASYRTADPKWETILDVDALARDEKANWVWEGSNCLAPDYTRCLVTLSDGGKDAVSFREFDTTTKSFVKDGFISPEGKQNYSWLDKDTVLIARDWGEMDGKPTMTKSSYPYVLKAWKRGTPLASARTVFSGTVDDVSVQPFVLRDADGKVAAVMATRAVSFFETEYYLLEGGPNGYKSVKLPLPLKSSIQGLVKGRLVFTLEQDWPEKNLKTGDLAEYDLAAFKADPVKAVPKLVLRPTERQAIEGITATRNTLVIALYENVKGKAVVMTPAAGGGWTSKTLDLPANASVSLGSASDQSDHFFVTVASYLTPTTLWLADGAKESVEQVKALPPKFDASKDEVEQFEAVSSDGTKIPYFVVHPKGMKLDGSNPTLLYAYGGFQVSMTPGYSPTVGKLWLERGGVYVVANIRGGGEFGPAWHNAGLKEHRQLVYDDFFAVSRDLIARKITSPRRLGIMGGSNGGLLMGVALTQHPELYNAIVIQVPLFDMIRYTQIGAGASWIGEYGDPSIPAERAWIEKYSPYQNLKAGMPYPEVYIETSTKDDRVHPAHARKAAARLEQLGYKFLYYENIDGGHAAAANLNETARRVSLEYTYLSQKLMD
jgi:prolyl oligopeptidase